MLGAIATAAIIDCAAWGTAFAQGNNQIPLKSESFSKSHDMLRSEALDGSAAAKVFEIGRKIIAGDLVTELDYNEHALLEYCMGAVSSLTYSFTDTVDDFFHLEIDKYTTRHRIQSIMCNGFTISGAAGESSPLLLSMNCVAYDQTTSATAITSLTPPTTRIWFDDLSYFYIGDQANALTTTDELPISGFELSHERNAQTDGKDSSRPSNVLQPIPNGFRTSKLKVNLARYAAVSGMLDPEQLATWRDAGTLLQGLFLFSRGGETMSIYLPEMKIEGGADWPVGGPGVITGELNLECFYNNNNSYMSTVEDQFEIIFT